MIPYGRQEVTEADINAVVSVLRSDFLTQGGTVPAFEEAVAAYCKAEFGVATNSATSALHLACLSLGVGRGDLVWTSPISFVASANCARYCGAIVDFVDIDPFTGNMSVDRLNEKLQQARISGSLPKVVIPVHMCGLPCEMAAIHALSKEYDFKIIEDASHAIGASYQNQSVGNCRYSNITVFSFHPVKIITTGEGGMAMTNSPELAEKMMLLRSHGITRDPSKMTKKPEGEWYYQQIQLGFNYRMTDIHAALGISQLERLDAYVLKRSALADRYTDLLGGLPITLPARDASSRSSWHLYVVRLLVDQIEYTHREIFDELRRRGIGVNLHYIPIYAHPYYAEMGFRIGAYPEAERYYKSALSLPLYPAMSSSDQQEVADALLAALGE